jgi:hypothetical protein
MRRLLGSITLAVALAASTWMIGSAAVHAAASGDGPNSQTISADCGSAGPVDVVINFQAGQFAAAHVVGGGTFVPTGFGEQTVTFTPPGGSPQTQTFPPITKGESSNASGDAVNCSFDFTVTDRHGGTAHIVGTVTGVIHAPQA